MKILIAPDKFKGSLTAQEVAMAIRDGIRDADPSVACELVPLADGGEGTADVLTGLSGGSFLTVEARDPLQRSIRVRYGLSQDGDTAFIEMAAATGLQLLHVHERNPLYTNSAGTGDLIRDALDRGARNICIGIGGSATNDGGVGAMTALGVKFLDATGSLLDGRGCDLQHIHTIDASGLHTALRNTSVTIFCDVDNPLSGPDGAAFVFAAQKGADAEAIEELDRGLRHYADVLQRHGYTKTDFPGAGAAGGFAVSLVAFAQAAVGPGIDHILNLVRLEDQIRNADVVVTGEGKLDHQTLSGKVVMGVASRARKYHKPVVAVAGTVSIAQEDLRTLHLVHLISLVDDNTPPQVAMARASELIRQRLCTTWKTVLGRLKTGESL